MQQKAFTVSHICRVLGMSRSGFYAHRKPRHCSDALHEQAHVRAAFIASGSRYGSRRLVQTVRAKGLRIGRHRVRTLMRENRLPPVWKRKFVATTTSRHSLSVVPNLLERRFDFAAPNQAWVSDITYIRTDQGWLYLAVVLDLYSRRVVSWATTATIPMALVVVSALLRAV